MLETDRMTVVIKPKLLKRMMLCKKYRWLNFRNWLVCYQKPVYPIPQHVACKINLLLYWWCFRNTFGWIITGRWHTNHACRWPFYSFWVCLIKASWHNILSPGRMLFVGQHCICLLPLPRRQHNLRFRSIPVFLFCLELAGRVLVEFARTWVGQCLGNGSDCTGWMSRG